MSANHVELTEANGVVYVSGPYHLMSENVNPRLKSQGFRWDGGARRWELPAAKLTPIKRKNLMKLLEPLTAAGASASEADKKSTKQKFRDEVNGRAYKGLCINLPHELRDKAKSLGGLWDDLRELWCMPDAESIREIQDAISQTPQMVALREIARRKAENLGVSIPYEYKDDAKSLGGLWDERSRMWYLPDSSSKQKVLDKIESDRESARQVALKHLEQERDKAEREQVRLGLKTYYFPGTSRGDHPAVGHTFKDRKTGDFMEVVGVKSNFYEEDGLSFGLMDDRGWLHVVTARPAQDAHAVQSLQDVEKHDLTVAEGRKRRAALAKEIQTHGEFPKAVTDHRRGHRLVLRGKNSIAYGGGDWFEVTPTHIWYIINNGGDGDSWENNNIETAGAGATGWRTRHTDALEKEILDLDALVGER